MLCVGVRRMTAARAALLLAAASAFSFAVQVLQVFEPTRDPALALAEAVDRGYVRGSCA